MHILYLIYKYADRHRTIEGTKSFHAQLVIV